MRNSKGRFVKGYLPETAFKIGHISTRKGIILSEETKKKISESKKGSTPWNKNKKGLIPEPWNKLQISDEERELRKKQQKQKEYQKHKEKYKKYKNEYYQKNRIHYLQKNAEWQLNNQQKVFQIKLNHLKKCGFPFKLDPSAYGFAIMEWSKIIKSRDSHTCQNCSSPAQISHHIIHKSKYPALSLNINNGIALCKKCHNEVHGWKLAQA